MGNKAITDAERDLLNKAAQSTQIAELALAGLRSMKMDGCKCGSDEVEIGQYRCRTVKGMEVRRCHRCIGNDEWIDTGNECGGIGDECSKCG